MKFSKIFATVTACTLAITGLSFSSTVMSHADTEELMNDNFEGTYGAWKGVGASTTLSSDQANTGDQSLYVYDRTASWGAPRCSLSTIVAEGYTYQISGYTYFEGSGSQNVGLKMLYTDSDGTDHYDNISYTYVNADTWTQLSGSYTVPTGATGVTLYIEYSDASTDQNYYIDDIVITGEAVEIDLSDSFFCDYEDGTTQSWNGRGSATAELSQTYAYSGESSLFVSGRTALWNGATIAKSDMIESGGYYQVGCYVLYDGNEWTDTQKFSINLQYDLDGAECYYTIATETANKGEWTYVGSEFTAPEGASNFYIYVQTGYTSAPKDQDLMDFYMDDAFGERLADPEIQYDIASLQEVYADYFKLGCACTASELTQNATKELILKHYNSLTLGNELKPDSVLDQAATLKYLEETGDDTSPQISLANADSLLTFAAENNIPVRGHVLVWHSQTPDWFFKENYDEDADWVDEETMTARLENYIKIVMETLAEEYPDVEFYAWDVVNEAASDSGTIRTAGSNNSVSGQSAWVQIYGDQSYIKLAFQFAREYAPEGCKLFYNDYNEYTSAKQAYIISDILEPLIEEGLIDGMGMQSHLSMSSPSIAVYKQAMQTYADLGLEIQVTELDISQLSNAEADQLELAQRYQELFQMYKEMKDSGVNLTAVVLWGITDSTSWIGGYPLLFDKYYQAKEAFYAVADTDYEVGSIQTMTAYYYDGTDEDLEKALEMGTAQSLTALTDSDRKNYDISFKAAWNEDGMVIRVYDDDNAITDVNIYGSTESQTGTYLCAANDLSGDAYTDIYVSDLTGEAGGQVYLDIFASSDIEYALATDPITYEWVTAVYAWNDDSTLTMNEYYEADGQITPTCGIVTLAAQPNYAEAIKTETAIEIDGVIDDAWADANTIDVNNYSMGNGATGVSRMLWDEDYIYILTEVTDPILSNASANAYEQDTVEVFFDENNHKTSSYEEDDIQVRVSYTGDKTVTDGLSTDRFVSAASVTADGYLVEIAIPNTLGSFSADQIVGFDVQVNDDGTGDGTRTSIANWNDLSGMGYTDPSGFGVLKLVDNGTVTSGTTTATTVETTNTETTTTVETDNTSSDTGTETTSVTTETTDSTNTSVNTDDIFYGDVNLDNAVNLSDSVLLNKSVAGLVTLSDIAKANADVNLDSYTDAEDALVLLKFQVSLITTLPYTG